MGKARDLTGEKFGRLSVLEFAGRRRTKGGESKRTWMCLCECGTKTTVDAGNLVRGATTSCGCFDKERRIKHGMHDTRFYRIWEDMKRRCDNQETECFDRYGGRGISYEESWRDFVNFKTDMFEQYEDHLTLDRINPNGNYSKGNCQWATKQEQGRNRTMMTTNRTGVTGVREWTDRKNGTLYFVADAQGLGTKKSRHFSTTKYGYDEAFKLACEYREKFIKEFNEDGVTFSEYHGQEKENK